MPQFRVAANGDARIRYLDSGDDRGAPVVFVPGFTCVAQDYIAVLPQFGRRTVVVELRGHGGSVAPSGPYDAAARAGDIGAVVDEVTEGPVHLAMFSRGTSYALHWALAHTDRVRSISIGDYLPEEIALPTQIAARVLDGRWRGTPVHQRVDRQAAVATFAAAVSRSFWEPLAQWGPPLLVIRSPTSTVIDQPAWARYREVFPAARLHEFPDSPHDIFRPDRGRYPGLVRELAEWADHEASTTGPEAGQGR
ncbi:alpha/beta fold hydrolase [Mycobacterium sp. MBM]|nr:alpha/beta fold hydrolase [Mycobacterium sp. MBM]